MPNIWGDFKRGRIGMFFGNDPSLLVYWQLQNNSLDNSGHGYNGTDTAVTYGQRGFRDGMGSVNFNGSNSYIQTPNLSAINSNTQPYSVAVWFNAAAAGVIVNETGEASISAYWHQSFMEILSSGSVVVRVFSLSPVTAGAATFNTWHYVVLTYDGTNVRSYLDGVAGGTTTGTRSSPSTIGYGEYFNLGAADSTNLGSGAWFNGLMEEFAVFSRALSPQEISQYYNWAISNQKRNTPTIDPSLLFNPAIARRRLLLTR